MKKTLVFLFSALLIVGMFVSCEANVQPKGTALVKFSGEVLHDKGLNASVTYENDLEWYYMADAESEDFNYGETSVWTKVEGTEELSLGVWDFELMAVKAGDSADADNAVYAGSIKGFLVQPSDSAVSIVIPVVAQAGGTGTIVVSEVTIALKAGSGETVKANKVSIDGAEVAFNAELPYSAASHSVRVWYEDAADGLTKADETITVSVFNGATTTISGFISEITQDVEIEGDITESFGDVSTAISTVVIPTTDNVTTADAVISNGALTVAIPSGVELVVEEGMTAGQVKTGIAAVANEDAAANIAIAAVDNAKVFELTLNVSQDNETELVAVSYQVGAGLEIAGVYHNDVALPSADGEYYEYDSATGVLTLYIYHASYITIVEGDALEVSNEAALKAAVALGGDINLSGDIQLETPVIVNRDVTIDLNGYDIEAGTFAESNGEITEGSTDSYVFWVKKGKLTINGDDASDVVAQDVEYSMAVWADGGSVVINGGHYQNKHWGDLIYAKGIGSDIVINGGTFTASNKGSDNEEGTKNEYSALNLKDNSKATITVKGGKFYKFDPANNVSEGPNTNFVAEGYSSVADGDYYVVEAIDGLTIDGNVYSISNANGLKWVANEVNTGKDYFTGKTVKLVDDIDLNNEEWTPIGSMDQEHGFCGNFDGNNKTIKNLKITDTTTAANGYAYLGLFGLTEGTETESNYIKNLTIENVTISSAGQIVSAAIAYPYYTDIENITVKGDIYISGGNYTAGILGYTRRCVNAKGLVIEGNTGSSITGTNTVGGVISDIQMNGGLTANYANFSASGLTISANANVGGISGVISAQTLDGATVENVTISCAEGNKAIGIVAGALGSTSIVKGISYSNVTGATNEVGAMYDSGAAAYCHGPYEDDNKYYFVPEVTVSGDVDAMRAALNSGAYIKMNGRLMPSSAFVHNNKSVIDGQDNYIWGGTFYSIQTSGGVIKNLDFWQAEKAINIVAPTSKVILDNVEVYQGYNVNYAFHCDSGNGHGLEAINCRFYAYISYAESLGDVKFTDCTFGANKNGEKGINAYAPTEFVNCTFDEECTVNIPGDVAVTFENCTYNGVAITADNLANVVTGNTQNASVI